VALLELKLDHGVEHVCLGLRHRWLDTLETLKDHRRHVEESFLTFSRVDE